MVFYEFLLEEKIFLEIRSIKISSLESKWSWLYKNPCLADDYFIIVILPYYIIKSNLTFEELNALGFNAFRNALKRGRSRGHFEFTFSQLRKKHYNKKKSYFFERFGIEFTKALFNFANYNLCERLKNFISKKVIRDNKKKFKLLFHLFGEIKCEKCESNVIDLPIIDIHHKKNKNYTLSDYYSGKCHLKDFDNSNLSQLCKNHHSIEQVKIPKIFSNIIFKKDLFEMNPEQVDRFLDNELKKFENSYTFNNYIESNYLSKKKEVPKKIFSKFKYQIKKWIKKRFIFKLLFNSKCISCGNDYLTTLDLHHIDTELKSEEGSFWQGISSLNIKEIVQKIIEEKCVSLCSNCHYYLHSSFHLVCDKVLKSFYDEDQLKLIKKKAETKFEDILNSLKKFEYPTKLIEDSKFSLELPFDNYNRWRLYLLIVYYYIKFFRREYMICQRFIKISGFSYSYFYNSLSKSLIERGYLKIVKMDNLHQRHMDHKFDRAYLTEKGNKEVIKIITKYHNYSEKVKERVYQSLIIQSLI
jgi:hypothetical protein